MTKRIIGALLICLVPALAWAETEQASRRVEQEKLQILEAAPSRTVAEANLFLFEAGGWINYRFSQERNSDNDKSSVDALKHSSSGDLRLWGRLVYRTPDMVEDKRQHLVYVRIKNIYSANAGADPGDRFDNRGPLLDYAYTSLDWRPWQVEAGRRYFNIGRGIAFSGVHDGVQLNYRSPGWNFGTFIAKTLPHESNIDTSIPGYDKNSLRYFGGVGIGYAGISDHQLYGYAVVERDHSQEHPEDIYQTYRYNAEYFGLGSKGQWGKRWPYWFEAINETGHSREDGTDAKSHIRSWAFDAEQKFQTLWRNGMVLSAEYAMGSGDPDRLSVTDTFGGNFYGKDRNFLYFGYIPTGIALAPRLSNIRMTRMGAVFFPFFFSRFFKSLSLGFDHFFYWKDRPEGGIYDLDATEEARYVGQEVDIRLDWRFHPRVICSVEWGHFVPGKAYPEETRASSDVFAVSLMYTF